MQALFSPASLKPTAALSPAPPAPTTTASYEWSMIGYDEVEKDFLTLREMALLIMAR